MSLKHRMISFFWMLAGRMQHISCLGREWNAVQGEYIKEHQEPQPSTYAVILETAAVGVRVCLYSICCCARPTLKVRGHPSFLQAKKRQLAPTTAGPFPFILPVSIASLKI